MENFKALKIWQRSMALTESLYSNFSMRKFNDHSFLIQQVLKSTFSIPSNIAEGCSRSSNKDMARFLEIALGSAFELETQLILLSKISNENLETELIELNEIQKMIAAFRKTKINSLVSKV